VPEETLVLDLLRRQHVIVHPGYFFDFEREAFLVVSLLPDPATFAGALDRLLPIAAGERPA
jgi:alanine-synthesizing transaminase